MSNTLEIILNELKRQVNDAKSPGAYLDDTDGPQNVCIDGWFDIAKLAEVIDQRR